LCLNFVGAIIRGGVPVYYSIPGCFMAENKDPEPKNVLPKVAPENLRAKYNTLQAYINSVVTFRFTTLGFYLAAVALILGLKPSFEKYLILVLITIPLYILELRNRFLKNDLGAQAEQIENKWGYVLDNKSLIKPKPTYIFFIPIPYNKDDYTKCGITHTFALDLLYGLIFFYALIHILMLRVSFILFFIHSLFRIFH
jgi:hypothetical protein